MTPEWNAPPELWHELFAKWPPCTMTAPPSVTAPTPPHMAWLSSKTPPSTVRTAIQSSRPATKKTPPDSDAEFRRYSPPRIRARLPTRCSTPPPPPLTACLLSTRPPSNAPEMRYASHRRAMRKPPPPDSSSAAMPATLFAWRANGPSKATTPPSQATAPPPPEAAKPFRRPVSLTRSDAPAATRNKRVAFPPSNVPFALETVTLPTMAISRSQRRGEAATKTSTSPCRDAAASRAWNVDTRSGAAAAQAATASHATSMLLQGQHRDLHHRLVLQGGG